MKTILILSIAFISLTFISCKKFLDEKSDATLATPSTLSDLQALLDNYYSMNCQFPAGSEVFCDNYYLTLEDWEGIYWEYERNYYLWQKDANNIADWQTPYGSICTCNIVLESLKEIEYSKTDIDLANNLRGAALFLRANYLYSLVQLYAKGYDIETSNSDPGIPLKLSTDFTQTITRPSVKETYNQIIHDLKESIPLLPVTVSIKSRPNKAAGYGALARIYLTMGEYELATKYADSCLMINDNLIDYNLLDINSDNPIERFNKEVIFQAVTSATSPLDPSICKIDSNLYQTYDSGDLRKWILFRENGDGTFGFKGDYDGGSENYGHSFCGIVTDEQYLILAECYARTDKPQKALEYLNRLLEKRYESGKFTPITESDPNKLLTIILNERRKELLFRGLRTSDLKRLNKDSRFQITIERDLGGKIYQLPPNDNKYVAQIPEMVIEMSGINQNP